MINLKNRKLIEAPLNDVKYLFQNLVDYLINHETEGEQEFRIGQWIESLDEEKVQKLLVSATQAATGEDITQDELQYMANIALTAIIVETTRTALYIDEETLPELFIAIAMAATMIALKRNGMIDLIQMPSIQDEYCEMTLTDKGRAMVKPHKYQFEQSQCKH